MDNQPVQRVLKHNITVNLLDGAFVGLAIGFASFVTVIPLFVNSITSSAILVGLIPAIHIVGWQLPQLFTAARISRLKRVKPMLLWMSSQERVPFLGMAAVAWLMPSIGENLALTSVFFLLIWQGLGSGFAANPWQSMIAKLIPSEIRGTFLGAQSAVANLFASLSAITAGWLLDQWEYPGNYALCFLLASLAMGVSWLFLAATKEPESQLPPAPEVDRSFWKDILRILREDVEFRNFLFARILLAFATLAYAFYSVYAVRIHGVSEARIGLMTGVYMGTQIAANPILGWIGDRLGHRIIMEAGVFTCIASILTALLAPSPDWFFLVLILAGISNVTVWTSGLAITMEFGSEADRPAYIGLANTLVAPSAILAPLLGGWLADRAGYPATFGLSIAFSLVTLLVFFLVRRKSRGAKR